jgi:hypothetical protein
VYNHLDNYPGVIFLAVGLVRADASIGGLVFVVANSFSEQGDV